MEILTHGGTAAILAAMLSVLGGVVVVLARRIDALQEIRVKDQQAWAKEQQELTRELTQKAMELVDVMDRLVNATKRRGVG